MDYKKEEIEKFLKKLRTSLDETMEIQLEKYPDYQYLKGLKLKDYNNVLNLSINPGSTQKSVQKYDKFNSRDRKVIQFCSFDLESLKGENEKLKKNIEKILNNYKIKEEYIYRKYYNANFDIFNKINGKYYWVGIDEAQIRESFERMMPYFIITISNSPKEIENIRGKFREKEIPIEIEVDNNEKKLDINDEEFNALNKKDLTGIKTFLEKKELKYKTKTKRENDIESLMKMYKIQNNEYRTQNAPLVFFNDLFWIADSNQNSLVKKIKTLYENDNYKKEIDEYIKNLLDLYIENYKLKLIVITNAKACEFVLNALNITLNDQEYPYTYMYKGKQDKEIPIIFSKFLTNRMRFYEI